MITNSITFLIICAFAFIPLFLGEMARKKNILTAEDFILQGRKLKIFPMYATVFATWMSIFAFVGAIAYFYEKGPLYMTTVGWDALFALLFFFLGKRIWYYGKVHDYMTPTDFFNDIYDSKLLNIIVTVLVIIATMIYLQVQIVGGLLVMNIATGGTISKYVCAVIFFAILVIYLWAGGLRAVAMTDIFYGALIVLTMLASGFFLLYKAGGTETMFNSIIAEDPSHVALVGPERLSRTMMWICLFIVVPTGAFMGPQMWIRNYAAASQKNFNVLPLLLCLTSIVCIGTLFSGSAGVYMGGNIDNPDTLLMLMMKKHANKFFYTFVLVGVFATIYSTANSQVHALASVFTIDVYKRRINNKAADKKLVAITRWAVLGVALLSYALMIVIPESIFDLAILALGCMAQLMVPVTGALCWERSCARGAIAGLLAGEAAFIGGVLCHAAETSVCAVIGLIINTCLFILVSLLSKPRTTVYRKIQGYKRDFSRNKWA